MESIVEQIIPTVGLGAATEYDIPIETVAVEDEEMDLTTKDECIEDNEDIPECAAVQSSSVRESQNNCVLSQRSPYLLAQRNIYTLNWQRQLSIRTLSFEETNNEYDDPELDKVYRKYILENSNSLQNTGDKSNSFDEFSIDKYCIDRLSFLLNFALIFWVVILVWFNLCFLHLETLLTSRRMEAGGDTS